tara:strand:+ start:1351 stop:1683 length:333 start_codon:yes stop_codon:yes gene_type:complete
MSLNIQETTFSGGWEIGEDAGGNGVRQIPISQLLYEGNMIDSKQERSARKNKEEIVIEWMYDDTDIEILGIRNDTTGEVYREYNDLPQNRLWTPGDELVVSALLMWGELG